MTDPLLRWREEFPILSQTVYMISNSLGAMPRGVYDKLHEYAETWATHGVRAWAEGWWELPVTVGNQIARIIGADPGSVSMHQNVTLASAVILSCLDFQGRRNKVVMTAMDFPSVLYLHQKFLLPQARLVIVPSEDGIGIPTEKLLAAIDEETRLVATSHVLFKAAYIQDVQAIIARAHAVGALVVIDGYQAVGTLPVDVKALGVDFYVGGCVKWLCGGAGGGYLYVRPDLAAQLEPRLTGWMAHPRAFAFETEMAYRTDGFRFLNGTPSVPALYAVQPGLAIIAQVGVEAIRAKSVRQTTRLIELAQERGFRVSASTDPARRGGTVAIDVPYGYEVSRELIRREFLVDYRPQAGIRISPHFYSTDEEIELTIREIDDILRTKAYERYIGDRGYVT
ncbi:MAG: kynureninase [Chloroflexota bacterium]